MNKSQRISIFPIILGLLSLVIGLILGSKYPLEIFKNQNSLNEIRLGGYKYTNPLLECESATIPTELRPFKTRLEEVVNKIIDEGRASQIAVYFRDLNNGPWFGVNEDEAFTPASLLKVPLMISYFKIAESDPSILNKEIEFGGLDNEEIKYEEENITQTLTSLKAGNKYKVEELIEKMIINSDNKAADLLAKNLNQASIDKPYLDNEIAIPEQVDNYIVSVRKYASFFRILFNSSYLDREYSEKALTILSKSEFDSGLRQGVPFNIEVANKFGVRVIKEGSEYQLHDCGIVYYPGRPYLVCIMTRGANFQFLPQVIGEVSTFIFQGVDIQK